MNCVLRLKVGDRKLLCVDVPDIPKLPGTYTVSAAIRKAVELGVLPAPAIELEVEQADGQWQFVVDTADLDGVGPYELEFTVEWTDDGENFTCHWPSNGSMPVLVESSFGEVVPPGGGTGTTQYDLDWLADVDAEDPAQNDYLQFDGTNWVAVQAGPGGGTGTSDHGQLTGLTDDDHAQYALADGSRGAYESAGAVAAHEAQADPHPNYLTPTEGAALFDANGAAAAAVSAHESDTTGVHGIADTAALVAEVTANTSKLAGVEALATTDQTPAEIKTAYESNAQTNAYDDAAVAKLAGVEPQATTDQTPAEIEAAIAHDNIGAGTIASHDTTATGAQLDTLTGGGNADGLHTHAGIGGATNIDDLGDVDTSGKSDQDQLKWDDTAGEWVAFTPSAGSGANLDYTPSTRVVSSSTGTNATLTLVDGANAGLMTSTDKAKLDGIEAQAAAEQTPAEIKTAYESNADTNAYNDAAAAAVAANTAKAGNATHTGDVVGSGALTLAAQAITAQPLVDVDVADHLLISDASDSGNLKKALLADLLRDPNRVNVLDYGAVRYDTDSNPGTRTSSSAGITAAILAAPIGGTVYVPAGDYYLATSVLITTRGNVNIVLAAGARFIVDGPAVYGIEFRGSSGNRLANITVVGYRFLDPNPAAHTGLNEESHGARFAFCDNVRMVDFRIKGAGDEGAEAAECTDVYFALGELDGCCAVSGLGGALNINQCIKIHIDTVDINDTLNDGEAIRFEATSGGSGLTDDALLENVKIDGATANGVGVLNGNGTVSNVRMVGGSIRNCRNIAFTVNPTGTSATANNITAIGVTVVGGGEDANVANGAYSGAFRFASPDTSDCEVIACVVYGWGVDGHPRHHGVDFHNSVNCLAVGNRVYGVGADDAVRNTGTGNVDEANEVFDDAAAAKLAGIEDLATTDQTPAEIKAAYESNADTNAFDDAAASKLTAIEAQATTDQTPAEIKTAYESNANTNALTDAEQAKLAGVEPLATTDQTPAEIKTAYESNADTNAYSDAAATKLAGIEALADVTDAAAVASAGAVMDSEIDANLKTLTVPASTTVSTFGASLVDDASSTAARSTLGLGTMATATAADYALRSESWTLVNHGATAGTARPVGWAGVIWYGSVQPANMSGQDIVIRTDEAI